MDSYKQFNKVVFGWTSTFLRAIGHDFLSGKFQYNMRTFFIYGVMFTSIMSELYTIIYYELVKKIMAFLVSMITFQGVVKMYQIRYAEELQEVFYTVQRLYKIHIKSESRERVEYFRWSAFVTEMMFKVIVTLYMLAALGVIPYPLYMYVMKNEVVPLVDLYIPGIDETTYTGYIILSATHMFYIFLASFGISASDFSLSVMVISPLIFSKLISLDLWQVNVDLEDKEPTVSVRSRFRNILLMHQELDVYMEQMERLSLKPIFGQMICASFGSIIGLFVCLTMNYFPAYGLAAGFLFQIFTPCLLGNFVELAHDRIYDSVLNLNWTELPLSDQRSYMIFIQRCQNPTILTVGGFYPLNLDTCVTIYSRIYNTTMLIYTMLVV